MSTRKNQFLLTQAKTNHLYMHLEDSILIGEEIKEDEDPGKGVFTYISLKKGEMVTFYSGWIISRNDADLLRKENTHSHIITRTYCVDSILGIETMSELNSFMYDGLGSFINDSDEPNVEVVNVDGHLLVKALRNIQSHEELYISYGKRYWEQSYERTEKGEALRKEIIARSKITTFSLAPTRELRRF